VRAVPVRAVPVRVFVDGQMYGNQPQGGVNRYFDELLPRLAAATGEPVRLLLPPHAADAGPATGATRENRLPLSGRRGFGRLPAVLRRLARERDDRRWAAAVDAVPGAVFHPSYYGTLPLAVAPTVVTVYDMIQEKFSDLFVNRDHAATLARKRACVTSAARLLAISERTKTDLCELFDVPPERVDVTPLAADADFWRTHATEAAAARFAAAAGLSGPYLLFVGSRHGYKNFAGLIEAYARWEGREDVTLAVIGRPWKDAERALLADAGVADRVRHCGQVNAVELAGAYAGAAAFVYPSMYEGFGLPPLEAMACGTPVAASTGGSIPEVVGDAAESFDPEDPDALAAALTRVLTPARSAELRTAGARRVEQFSWDRTAALTLDGYRRALADAG
jgi:glycosyltransferase involved in cell wall biosynthesis